MEVNIQKWGLGFGGLRQIFRSKIQNFFQTFFQNNNSFFQIQGYQIGDDQQRPQKMSEQIFFHDVLQNYGQDWIRFDQHEKNSLLKHSL